MRESHMTQSVEKAAYIGMDLGGSNLYSAVFDDSFSLLAENKIDTEAKKGYNHVLDRIHQQVDLLRNVVEEKGYRLRGLGLGVPGIVSAAGDLIRVAPNLGWINVRPLHDMGLATNPSFPSLLVNDVNAGLMGELTRYNQKPSLTLSYFCGTGIGGALALEDHMVTGFDGGAGEVGHMVVEADGEVCGCGRRGCLEAYVGKWALNRLILKRFHSSKKKTRLKKIIGYDLEKTPVKSSSLKKGYEAEDDFTRELMEEYYCKYLAMGISQSVNLLNPELVILGGGIMEAMGVWLLPHVHRHLAEFSINTLPRVTLAELGDLAGPTGAAYLASLNQTK